jgi:retron-type reverse transcriptase
VLTRHLASGLPVFGDPAFLLVAWDRVRSNKGARSAGVDGYTAYSIEAGMGVEVFLDRLRASLKDRSFCPVPVRERMIPKAGWQETPSGDRHHHRPGGPSVSEAGVGADFRGGLPPVLVRVPSETPDS